LSTESKPGGTESTDSGSGSSKSGSRSRFEDEKKEEAEEAEEEEGQGQCPPSWLALTRRLLREGRPCPLNPKP